MFQEEKDEKATDDKFDGFSKIETNLEALKGFTVFSCFFVGGGGLGDFIETNLEALKGYIVYLYIFLSGGIRRH